MNGHLLSRPLTVTPLLSDASTSTLAALGTPGILEWAALAGWDCSTFTIH